MNAKVLDCLWKCGKYDHLINHKTISCCHDMATDSNYTLLKFVVTVFCHKISQKHSKKTTKTKSIPQHCCGPIRGCHQCDTKIKPLSGWPLWDRSTVLLPVWNNPCLIPGWSAQYQNDSIAFRQKMQYKTNRVHTLVVFWDHGSEMTTKMVIFLLLILSAMHSCVTTANFGIYRNSISRS